ncbi:MAG: hypothetical protein EOO02_22910, partial [Chitinophagaceae bacterium]
MEILILQYAILVLICLWRADPTRKIKVGHFIRIPLFNLQCCAVLIFVTLFTYAPELAAGVTGHGSGHAYYTGFNLLLFLVVPGAFLYVRVHLMQRPLLSRDLLHLLVPVTYFTVFLVPHLISPEVSAINSPLSRFFYRLFGYTVLCFYLVLLLKFLLEKYQAFSTQPDRKPLHEEIKSGKVPFIKTEEVAEVQVGSVQLDAIQLARMDYELRNFFVESKPFLRRGYNLRQLSVDTSFPLHHLSAFINQYYHVNYNDFINEYRVHYCKEKIRNDEWRAKTLEAIAEESGFNNRNT